MDLLAQHEAFLRAIFDAPDDDTPRLVYADFLQENGEDEKAAFIRYECEIASSAKKEQPRLRALVNALAVLVRQRRYPHAPAGSTIGRFVVPAEWPWADNQTVRGFPLPQRVVMQAEQLAEFEKLRENIVRWTPEWFGATAIRLKGRFAAAWLDPLFGLPALAGATELELSGEEVPDENSNGGAYTIYHLEPVITTAAVVALTQHRGLRRVERLDLRNNDLDNDAARALVKSPYLGNLKRLQLLEGNRLRGKVWQQVIERFGEDVVG